MYALFRVMSSESASLDFSGHAQSTLTCHADYANFKISKRLFNGYILF